MISSLSNFQCSDEEASNSRKMTPIIPTPCLVAHEQQLPPKMEEVSLLTSKEGKSIQLRTKR